MHCIHADMHESLLEEGVEARKKVSVHWSNFLIGHTMVYLTVIGAIYFFLIELDTVCMLGVLTASICSLIVLLIQIYSRYQTSFTCLVVMFSMCMVLNLVCTNFMWPSMDLDAGVRRIVGSYFYIMTCFSFFDLGYYWYCIEENP